jgi:hypothetical protein
MRNNMKLLIGLLALGIVFVGGGILFLLLSPQQSGTKVMLTPLPGSYLMNSQNESSEVLLQTVNANKTTSDKQYVAVYSSITVNMGDDILAVSCSVKNKHLTNTEIMIYAAGYDKTGKQVAWTLDSSSIMGQVGLHLENGQAAAVTLHLNYTADMESIHIFANSYNQIPP